MGGSSGGSSDTTIHYDSTVMNAYQQLIWYTYDGGFMNSLNQTPYSFGMSDVNNAFLDFHNNFYLVYMANIDPVFLLTQIQDIMVNHSVIDADIAAENQFLEDDINQNILPKLRAGLRDIGAVMTSAFLDAQALVEMNKQKTISKYSAGMKIKALDMSHDIWAKLLAWRQGIVQQYLDEIKNYYACAHTYFTVGNDVTAKNILWPWTILDNVRAIVGSLNGAQAGHSTTSNPPGLQVAGQYVGMAAGLGTTSAYMAKAFGWGSGAASAGAAATVFEGGGLTMAESLELLGVGLMSV
jgi:hypothetical protein